MLLITVVDCQMAGVLYRYLMDYSPVLLLGAALCWLLAETLLARRRRRSAGGGPAAGMAYRHGGGAGMEPVLPFLHAFCDGALAAGNEPVAVLYCEPPGPVLDVR